MIVVEFQELHFMSAVRTHQRVVTEGRKNGDPPLVETPVEGALGSGDGTIEFRVDVTVPCVESAITDHFKMLFWYVADQTLNEIHSRDGFLDIFFIPVAMIVEGDRMAIIIIDPGRGDDRPAKIAADVFDNRFRIAEIRFCIDIKALFVVIVTFGLCFFEGGAEDGFHLIQESSTKSVAKKRVVEMFDMTPETIIAVAAFGNETMDVWIPFQIPAEGMEDHDEAGSKVF